MSNTIKAHVVWADGTSDSERECNICETKTCVNPIHGDSYKVQRDTLAAKWDKEYPCI